MCPWQASHARRVPNAMRMATPAHSARHVRFTPESGHVQCSSSCLLWAISGHSGCNEAPLFRTSNEYSSAGQNNPDFGELAELRIDFN
jgi:hypothetical protein